MAPMLPLAKKKIAAAAALVVFVAVVAGPAGTGAIVRIGTCLDMGVPKGCVLDECLTECSAMGGDDRRAGCNDDHKCCCPGRNELVCEGMDNCSWRIKDCRHNCQYFWDLPRAYCKGGLGDVREQCCCRPNGTAADAGDGGNVHRRIGRRLHQLELPH